MNVFTVTVMLLLPLSTLAQDFFYQCDKNGYKSKFSISESGFVKLEVEQNPKWKSYFPTYFEGSSHLSIGPKRTSYALTASEGVLRVSLYYVESEERVAVSAQYFHQTGRQIDEYVVGTECKESQSAEIETLDNLLLSKKPQNN